MQPPVLETLICSDNLSHLHCSLIQSLLGAFDELHNLLSNGAEGVCFLQNEGRERGYLYNAVNSEVLLGFPGSSTFLYYRETHIFTKFQPWNMSLFSNSSMQYRLTRHSRKIMVDGLINPVLVSFCSPGPTESVSVFLNAFVAGKRECSLK